MTKQRTTRKEQKETRREEIVAAYQKQLRQDKKKKISLWTTISVLVAVVATIVILALVSTNTQKVTASLTSPNNLSTNGVILTSPTEVVKGTGYNLTDGKPAESATLLADSKVPHVQIYLDYACPHCEEFEVANGAYLTGLLEKKQITLESKPIVVIGTDLSYSGGNAAACVAEYAPSKFNEFSTQLFGLTKQPGVTSRSVSNLVKKLGLPEEDQKKTQECVTNKVYKNWLTTATDHALSLTDDKGERLVTGTPAVFVDNVLYDLNPTSFQTFMNKVIMGSTPAEALASSKG